MVEKQEIKIEPSWKKVIEPLLSQELREKIRFLYKDNKKVIYPNPKNIFNAFNDCPFDSVSVVILGQDPYHGDGQANGLCFSVSSGVNLPPSLQNIFKEIKNDVGNDAESGDLTRWAKQGVFLLNCILTVEKGKPASHHNIGWEEFTNDIISALSKEKENLVFILWGNYAKEKEKLIDNEKHLILTSAHPSPFSASNGFFGNKHFSKTNNYLISKGKYPINW